MFQFVIRITSSLVLLGIAIWIHQYLPNSEFYDELVKTLLAFWIADGPIYGIQKGSDRIDDDELRQAVVVLSIAAQGIAVLVGIAFLAIGCKHIP